MIDSKFRLPETESIILDEVMVAVTEFMDVDSIEDLKLDTNTRSSFFLANQLGARLRAKMYRSVSTENVATESVPVTWRDHLKSSMSKRWPKWNLKWNTREIVTQQTVYRTCPHLAYKDNTKLHFDWLSSQHEVMPRREDPERGTTLLEQSALTFGSKREFIDASFAVMERMPW